MAKVKKKDHRATSPVVLGFEVKKRWSDEKGKEKTKTVSRMFASRGAADVFMGVAEKAHFEPQVVYFVSEVLGFDDIP